MSLYSKLVPVREYEYGPLLNRNTKCFFLLQYKLETVASCLQSNLPFSELPVDEDAADWLAFTEKEIKGKGMEY